MPSQCLTAFKCVYVCAGIGVWFDVHVAVCVHTDVVCLQLSVFVCVYISECLQYLCVCVSQGEGELMIGEVFQLPVRCCG